MKKKIVSIVLGLCMFVTSVPAIAATGNLTQTSSAIITSGAQLKQYNWDTVDGNIKAAVIEIDLTNPYVELGVITSEGKFTQRATVSNMAMTNAALAAINGDFFNTKAEGAPIGTTVIDGVLASSQSVLTDVYNLAITTDRTAYIEAFAFAGSVTASNGKKFPLSGLNKTVYWEEPVGVHSHIDKLHIYNDFWGGSTRGNDEYVTMPAELLVQNNKVVSIKTDGFFDFAVPKDSYIIRGDGTAKEFILNNFNVGDEIHIDYTTTPNRDWATVIGGHSLLVNNGQMVEYTKDLSALKGVRARTAAGISKDGKKIYLVSVEGRTSDSVGITLGNLSLLMTKLGAYKAVNLDGGGSTTMVSRPLGEFSTQQVIAVESNSAERKVVNGLGVFSSAPQAAIQEIMLSGSTQLLVGETTTYTTKAYDEHYNSVDTSKVALNFTDSSGLGTFNSNVFTARSTGNTTIVASNGIVSKSLAVAIVGKESIQSMSVSTDKATLVEGASTNLTVKATLKDGSVKTVSPNALQWTVTGFTGEVSNSGVLTVQDTNGASTGKVTASYDGFTAETTVVFEKADKVHLLNSLDGIYFDRSPASTTGGLSVVADPTNASNQVVQLSYNFQQAKESAAAYMSFSSNGLAISNTVKTLYLDVYGYGNGEWLRAEIQDGNGEIHRFDLTRNVDWNGWQQLSVNIGSSNLQGELAIKRVYAVELANENRNQTAERQLLFKNLRVVGSAGLSNGEISLQLGSTQLVKNGEQQQMDVAPVLINNRTMVPIRFITEAYNGQVEWQESSRTAMVFYGSTLLELPVDQGKIVINGAEKAIDVSSQIMNGRTMVPLRAVSEGLGMTVEFIESSQTIVIGN